MEFYVLELLRDGILLLELSGCHPSFFYKILWYIIQGIIVHILLVTLKPRVFSFIKDSDSSAVFSFMGIKIMVSNFCKSSELSGSFIKQKKINARNKICTIIHSTIYHF